MDCRNPPQLLASEHSELRARIEPIGFIRGTDVDARSHTMRPSILAFLLLFVASTFQAQQKRPAVSNAYAVTAVDATSARLSPNYRGVDPEALCDALEKRFKESSKGEFETTAAFEARLQRMQTEPLVGALTKDDLIPVVGVSDRILDRIESKYDADTEELTVTLEPQAPIIGVKMDFSRRSTSLKYNFRPTTTYVGVNAYGAKTTVEQSITYIYSLLFENVAAFSTNPPEQFSASSIIETRLKLTPSAARAAKENLRVLFLIRLVEPSIEKGYLSKKPTISAPRDTLAVYHYLHANVEQIWIYNYETGQIYKKLISAK